MTFGIALGSWWSYEVLGWSGVWAWDPVENASLLPWITGTAYIHSVLVQERMGMLRVWNYYMNEFSAAIGIEQLKKLDKLNNVRKKIAKRFSKELIIPQKMPFDQNCSYHFFWILVKNRNNFMKKMTEKNIETGIHYNPIHKMKLYANKQNLPKTEEITKQIISIPCHANLKDDDVDKIIKFTNKFV